MPLTVITREAFTGKRWHPHSHYHFALGRGVVELTAAELPQAACSLPIGLLAEDGGHFLPVALMGIHPERNLFVAQDGTWLGPYVPAVLRASPFALGTTEHGGKVLCVDETLEAAAAAAAADAGEPFFTADGEPSPALEQARNFLAVLELNRQATQRACAALAAAQLIQPWEIVIPTLAGKRHLEGLHSIDEKALNVLAAEPLSSLRDCGALAMAYCLMICGQHLAQLGKLADAHAKFVPAEVSRRQANELDLSFLSQGGTLQLGNMV